MDFHYSAALLMRILILCITYVCCTSLELLHFLRYRWADMADMREFENVSVVYFM